jgi:hypothetical protein
MSRDMIKHIINSVIRKGYWFNNVSFDGCSRLIKYKVFNTDVVNLGSTSAVHAFNYEGMGIKGGNWAMPRNPLLGDYAILRNYSSFLKKKGSIVIISLCPFSAFSGSYDYLDDRFYTILYPTTIPNYCYSHELQVRSRWNNPLLTYPIFALFLDIWHIFIRGRKKKITEEELQRDAEYRMKSWMHEFSIKDFSLELSLKNKDAIEDAAGYLNNIIGYCRDNGASPVIVIPPVYHTLNEMFSPKIKTILFDKLLGKIDDKSVPFFNYMDSKHFTNDISLFRDSFLLNNSGAKKFTKLVLEDLRII